MKKKKNLALFVMATAIAVPVMVAPSPTEAQTYSKTFTDVTPSHPYYDIIHGMAAQGIINGYPDGKFRPNTLISRQHAALLINKVVDLKETTPLKKFKDVPDSYMYYNAIQKLQKSGLIQPDSNGNFQPNKSLTRGEMAKILTIAFDLKVKADYQFPDVVGTGYEEYVKALYSNGVTTGYGDYTFKVNEPLTRAHYALFMNRAMNLDPNFVPEPIEVKPTPTPTPTPKPTPTEPSDKVSDYPSDKVLTKDKTANDLVVPGGETASAKLKEQQDEGQKLKQDLKVTSSSSFNMNEKIVTMLGVTYNEMLTIIANDINKSVSETIQLINYTYSTGETFVGDTFFLYYNYQSNLVVYSYRD